MEEDFNVFFKANERRIHYQIQRLRIPQDLYEEFYAEGIVALWHGYKHYKQGKGNLGTFLNYQIRFRLIDLIRKSARDREVVELATHEEILQMDDGNRHKQTGLPIINESGVILENEEFWNEVRKELTPKQWKWVHYFIIANLTIKEIMEIENVSADAVKSWARQVRKKLKHEGVREKLEELM